MEKLEFVKVQTDEETGDVFLELEQLVGPDIASKAKFYTLEHDDNNVLILTLFDKDEKKITLTK